MYLSRLMLNPFREGTRDLLGSPQTLHARMHSLFPPVPDTDPVGRFLYRMDSTRHAYTLYVVSRHKPDFTDVKERCGWPTSELETEAVRPYGEFLGSVDSGQVFHFRFTGNPVHYAERPGVPGSYFRAPHVTVPQKVEWLGRLAERNGFRMLSEPSVESLTERFVKSETAAPQPRRDTRDRRNPTRPVPATRPEPGKVRVTLAKSTFEGTLTVTDPDALRRALVSGMGKAKAYGCGLMTLSR